MPTMTNAAGEREIWVNQAIERARLLTTLQWTPVADRMPIIRMESNYVPDKEYIGTPYSNGGWEGRIIGYDISVPTFLAAVENPDSLIYKVNFRGLRKNSAGYYGTVCSALTSYAYGLGFQRASAYNSDRFQEGIRPAEPQSAQGASSGDLLFMKGHVEIVTGVDRAPDGTVTHVTVDESRGPTARTKHLTAEEFDTYLQKRKITLYHIYDLDTWRGDNREERFLFPNYELDATPRPINRVLLLDLGDWVNYPLDQPVRFNVMDRDNQGAHILVIKRGDAIIEQIPLEGPGVVERRFDECGDYTAYCILGDGSASQACEFAVCNIEFRVPDSVSPDKDWIIEFNADNLTPIRLNIAYSKFDPADPVTPYTVWLTDEVRSKGSITVPAGVLSREGTYRVFLTGEHPLGRIDDIKVITF